MGECISCQTPLNMLRPDIKDYEYGVVWKSQLVMCKKCGLVTHEPQIEPKEISSLYPSTYLAHTASSGSKSIYGFLKQRLAKHTLNKLAKKIPKDGVFLEVGCGNAHLLKRLSEARKDISVVGVDIEDVKKPELHQFTFHHGQLEEVDIPAKSIDVIYCSNLIEHVPDPRVFLQKCLAILKPGGLLYGVTPNHLSLDRYIFRKYWAGYHYPRHTFVFNHKNLKHLMQKQGFNRVSIKGSYAFWYLSLANRFVDLPGTKKRGIMFAAITGLFFPFDLLVNLFRCHGSMAFQGRKLTE